MRKIYIVGGNRYMSYLNWILPLGFEITNDRSQGDVIFFGGGEDVHPSVYGQRANEYVYCNPSRDSAEILEYEFSKDKPKIGICRGSQFLTAVNGGKIVQHMEHPYSHVLSTNTGEKVISPSEHHNQMLLDEGVTGLKEGVDYELIGWTVKLSPFHLGEDGIDYNFPEDYREPEIVWYPKTQCWVSQGHVENYYPPRGDEQEKYINFCQKSLMSHLQF